uniref:Mannose-P-dolichol utilization defect 1 protein homolog n=1 Tax=Oryza nivara TaxID=4536 RepID=A0A0E0I0Q3_ORYNI
MVAAAGTMELEILGINFGCVLAALADAKIPEKDCLLPLASKLLGYAIVAASTTVKLPQILKILKHGSVRGLSVASFELEVVGYTIALAYCIHKGLPFSAYCGLAPTVLGGKIDPALFEVLYASQHAIFFFARLPQIWKNFMNKGTGELSFLTCFMNFAGSIVRVFTSIQEKTPLSGILLVLITA